MTHYFARGSGFNIDYSYAFHYTNITCPISEMNNYGINFGNDKDNDDQFFLDNNFIFMYTYL